jgi:lipopolysaccharide export system protein LptA
LTPALATLLAALAGAATPAGEAVRAGPVHVDADEVHYAFQRREVTFLSKDAKPVTMTRDDAKLTCRKAVAKTDAAGQIVSAVCDGDVRFTRGPRVVTCAHATYDAGADRVTCEGDPVLRDGNAEVKATRLVYELRSDEVKAEGAKITLPGEEVEQRRKALEQRRAERRQEAKR